VERFKHITVKIEPEMLTTLIIDVAEVAGVPVFKFQIFIHNYTLFQSLL